MKAPLLAVERLAIDMARPGQTPLRIVNDLSFELERGQTLGIVGESGSGKSMLSLALIGLLPGDAITSGSVRLDGQELLGLDDRALCAVRGRRIGMIFQEPMTALNPGMRVGDQIAEGLVRTKGLSRTDARPRVLELLERVRIPDARRRIDAYPHEMSGGQRQRIGIAIALALEPSILLADEPTTALDVTVQAEILDIVAELVRDSGMALILVSHDLGVIARATERMLVLYAGTRLEDGATAELLRQPANPYTAGLLKAMPRRLGPGERLFTIPGGVPPLTDLPPGCRFAPRCEARIDACEAGEPRWRNLSERHGVRCIRASEEVAR